MSAWDQSRVNSYISRLESIVEYLLDGYSSPGTYVNVIQDDITFVCSAVTRRFLQEPMLLEISSPLIVVGDMHGQFHDLLRIFNTLGQPPETRYLFLGDYVDRGPQSVELMTLLFAYKLLYPNDLFLLRGNHESHGLASRYGLKAEIENRLLDVELIYERFLQAFENMPIAAIVDDKIFCVHGGLSPLLMDRSLDEIRTMLNTLFRPAVIPQAGLLTDLVWSDPLENAKGFRYNTTRGISYFFGEDTVDRFLNRTGLNTIIRAHEFVPSGLCSSFGGKLLSLFSAPNYQNREGNPGAVGDLHEVGQQLQVTTILFQPENIQYYIPWYC
ncbi:hypothetical protein Aperf_G00000093854 [Anoplocephala perfoliata]